MVATMKVIVLMDVTLCSRYKFACVSDKGAASIFSTADEGRTFLPKCEKISTRQYGITFQKKAIFGNKLRINETAGKILG
jgi:hypothetical protein